jgi:hypothetical protein
MNALKRRLGTVTNGLTRRIRRIGLTARLCVAGVAVGIVPLVIVAVVAYENGSRSILDKVSRATTQTIEQVSTVVGTNLQIINDGIEIAYSDQFQKALSTIPP